MAVLVDAGHHLKFSPIRSIPNEVSDRMALATVYRRNEFANNRVSGGHVNEREEQI